MGTGWNLWLRGPRAVQRELDRSDAELVAAMDALEEARQAVGEVRAVLGEDEADVVDLGEARLRRRTNRPKVPVVAIAVGTAALVAAAAFVNDSALTRFLPNPDAELRRPDRQAGLQLEFAVATDATAPTELPRAETPPGSQAPAADPQAASPGAPVEPTRQPEFPSLPPVPPSLPPLPPLPPPPDVPPLPPLPPVPPPPDVPPLPPVPPVPPLPPVL